MQFIKFEKQGFVGSITIDRVQALNALNNQVIEELSECMDTIEKSKDLRCLIITGAGDKAFVAGADIKELETLSPEKAQDFAMKGQRLFRRFEVLEIPIIAAVNGYALGGGCELAIACDFIYASTNAVFGLPEVTLGIMPGFGGTQRLARYVGLARAKEMMFTAKQLKADEAQALGLVNKVCSPESLMEEVKKTASKIANLAPIAITAIKGASTQGYDLSIDPGLHLERTLFSELFRSKDMQIGVKAFINKQKPEFIGE
ncbi:MAG: enoyl-CoA hydratase/isomerase family protein [Bdellovibrionales bacterium]|nr:enoyl-CoA hydratase/isomerase family protein [Bdellovibrionales bacterium]